ncbi:MAG: SprT family zinc-dependent metalloprotease [Coriobacteriia bacterium]|nr:SprT family zinc-dependent metalloprotease [Coriobacteriia bacterium]
MESRGQISYGAKRIAFEVLQSDRRTLEIAVNPDGTVVVVAPVGAVYEDVCARVVKRARWIARQQAYFEQFSPRTPVRRFVSGESHLYAGRRYRLRVSLADTDSVKMTGGRIEVRVSGEVSSERVEALTREWYSMRARERLTERFDECWERFGARCGTEKPRLRIRRLRSRWGSLSAAGALTLNIDLVRAPRDCVDYVIYHELCHLEHGDHGAAFRARLEQVLPDWERRKHRLEVTLA